MEGYPVFEIICKAAKQYLYKIFMKGTVVSFRKDAENWIETLKGASGRMIHIPLGLRFEMDVLQAGVSYIKTKRNVSDDAKENILEIVKCGFSAYSGDLSGLIDLTVKAFESIINKIDKSIFNKWFFQVFAFDQQGAILQTLTERVSMLKGELKTIEQQEQILKVTKEIDVLNRQRLDYVKRMGATCNNVMEVKMHQKDLHAQKARMLVANILT